MATTIEIAQPEKVEKPLLESSAEETKAQSFLVWSILGNICCLFTCGLTLCCSIPALVFSLNVNSGVKRNDKKCIKRNSVLAFFANIITATSILLIFIVSLVFWIYIVYFSAKGVEWFCELPLNWTC